jgi:hypothetical protein
MAIWSGYLVYFMASWSFCGYFFILRLFGMYILWLFGIFPPFWYVVPRKIWQPCLDRPFRINVNQCGMRTKEFFLANFFLNTIFRQLLVRRQKFIGQRMMDA